MSGQQDLVKIFDYPSDEESARQLMALLDQLDKRIKEFHGISIMGKNPTSTSEFKASAEAMAAAMEKIAQLEKELQTLQQKGATKKKQMTDEEIRDAAALSLARQKATASAKDEIRINEAAEGSLNKKRLQLKALLAAYDALSGAEAKAAQGQALLKNIKELGAEVLTLEKNTGRAQRNVGNYPEMFKNFGDVGKEALEKVNGGFNNLFKNILSTAVAFVGVQGIFEFFKSSIETFEKSEVAVKREENALKNLGASVKDVDILKESINDLTTKFNYLGKTDLRESQQKLVTYGKLTAQQISGLMPTIVNFAANARIGVGEATDTIIKGLEGNARALRLYGINIKDAGNFSERFGLIQTELATKVAGSAEVFAESGEGKIEAYKKQLGALKKGIGEQLMPVYEAFLDKTLTIGNALKQLNFGSIIKGIIALTGVWLTYRAVLLAVNLVTVINTSAQIANRAITEGVTIAKAAETLAEETNGKTKAANTVLTYLLVAAQRVYAFVTRVATFEVTLFGNALRITPLGLFLTLLGLTITAFGAFASSSSRSAAAMEKNREAAEATTEAVKKANEHFADQNEVIDELVKKVEDHNSKLGDRKKALEELIKLDPHYLEGLTLENIETEKGVKIIDAYVEALHRKANAEAAQEILKSDAIKRTKAQLDLQVENENFQKQLALADKARQDNIKAGNFKDKDVESYFEGQVTKLKVRHQAVVDELNGTITEVDNREGALNDVLSKNKSNATFNQDSGLGKYVEKDKDAAKKVLEYQIKLLELLKQEQIDRLKIVADNPDAPGYARLEAERKIFQLEKELIEGRRDLELKESKLTASQRAYIIEKANDDLFKKEMDSSISIMKIYAETNQKRRDDELFTVKELAAMNEAYWKAQEDLAKKAVERRKDAVNGARAYELQALESMFAAGLITQKNYEDQKAAINAKADIYGLEADKVRVLSDIARAKKKGEDITKLARDQAEIESQIEAKKDAAKIKSNKEVADRKKKLFDEEIQLGRQVEDAAAEFIKGSYEKEINAIQQQIEQNNKLKEVESERIGNSSLSEQQKAAELQILNNQTASQNEALQRKQRDEKLKEAQFDRDKSIFDIVANTAVSIIKTNAELGLPAALPFDAIAAAMGAAQIAAILAKPIPHYEVGTDFHPGGPMVVHPGELRVEPDGTISQTPDQATLTFGERGTRIIPAHEVNQMLFNNFLLGSSRLMQPQSQERLEQKLDQLNLTLQQNNQAQLAAMRKQKAPVINIHNNAAFWAHIDNSTN